MREQGILSFGMAAKRRSSQQGMSLLEVMISMSVLLVVFLSITLVVGKVRDTQETVQEEETALFHAEGIKEAIAGTPFRQIPLDDNQHFPADGTDVTTLVSGDGVAKSLPDEAITVIYSSGPDLWGPGQDTWDDWVAGGQNPDLIPDPLEINIQVQWTSTHGPRTLTLTVARASSVP